MDPTLKQASGERLHVRSLAKSKCNHGCRGVGDLQTQASEPRP